MEKCLVADKKERGQSLAELAISLTFLLILVGGIIDLGRMFFTYITLRDAAQEGASYGSYACAQEGGSGDCIKGPTFINNVKTRVRQSSQGNGSIVDLTNWPLNQITVTMTTHNGNAYPCSGDEITVKVQDPNFDITMPFIGAFIGQQILIQSTASDVILAPACPTP